MAETSRPEIMGGGMWIGFQPALEDARDSERAEKFVLDLVALFQSYGIKAERGHFQRPGDQTLCPGVYTATL